jgi:hypothetical protein
MLRRSAHGKAPSRKDDPVGIEVGNISIARRLPIDRAILPRVLGRLRDETVGLTLHWQLGDRGTCDVEVDFELDAHAAEVGVEQYVTAALLSDPQGTDIASVEVTVGPCEGNESQLELRPTGVIGPWWDGHISAYLDLAHAVIEELAQELLWYHSRLVGDSAA